MKKNPLVRSATLAVTSLALAAGAAVPAAFAQDATPVVASIAGDCGPTMQYEEDCIAAIRDAIEDAAELSDADKELVYARVREVAVEYPSLKRQIDRVLEQNDIPIEAPEGAAAPAAAP